MRSRRVSSHHKRKKQAAGSGSSTYHHIIKDIQQETRQIVTTATSSSAPTKVTCDGSILQLWHQRVWGARQKSWTSRLGNMEPRKKESKWSVRLNPPRFWRDGSRGVSIYILPPRFFWLGVHVIMYTFTSSTLDSGFCRMSMSSQTSHHRSSPGPHNNSSSSRPWST